MRLLSIWSQRVEPEEQFGRCDVSGAECGHDGDCSGGGDLCSEKASFRDSGFLEGPIAVSTGGGSGGCLKCAGTGWVRGV